MKSLKEILRKFDIFDVPLTFRYKTKEKYSTSLRGLTIIILYFVISVWYILFYTIC